MIISLNARQRARLDALKGNVQIAQQAYGVALGALLDAADIDAATVASADVTSDGLAVVLSEPVAPTPHDPDRQ